MHIFVENTLLHMRNLLFWLLLFSVGSLKAQTYGNEWIKNNQKYFKIKIGREGIYRIDYTSLIPAATDMKLDLSTVNPKKWQMFYKGKEVPIYVAGESDNIFNNYDFIEFYAQLNDAELDKELYGNPNFLANDRYSVITDTSNYYLTFLPSTSTDVPRHLKNYSNTNFSSYPEVPYFLHESFTQYVDRYNFGRGEDVGGSTASNPDYTETEGYGSIVFGNGTGYSNYLASTETRFYNSTGPLPVFSFASSGASDKFDKTIPYDHKFKLFVSKDNNSFTQVLDTFFDGYTVIRKSMTLNSSLIGGNATYFRFDPQFVSGVTYQAHALNFVSVTYPRNFDLDGNSSFKFKIQGDNSPKHVVWQNYTATKSDPILYDLTNDVRIRGQKNTATSVRAILPGSSASGTYYIHDSLETNFLVANDIFAAISYETVAQDIEYIKFDPTSQINKNRLVLLTTPKFMGDYASEYLLLRQSTTATSPNTMVSVNQLYEHFSYGVPHPIAIRRYLRYLKENGDTMMKFLFMVGRGYQTNMVRGAYSKNIIPSIGVPASDNMFGTEITGSGLAPVVAIGRLTIDRPADFGTYLNKLLEYEASTNEFWRKKILHLAGGDNGAQASYIKYKLDVAGEYVKGCPMGGTTSTFTKSSVGISEPFIKQKAIENVNQGIQMITFLGHGSAAVTDIDIGDTIEYNNRGKYPVFYFNGCSIGNPCLGPPDKNIKLSGENFMKARNKGAIAFIAQSSLSELGHVDAQIQDFYRIAFRDNFTGNLSIGETVQKMLKSVGNYSDTLNIIQSRILFLQGDPSIQWFQPQLPDFQINESTLFTYPENISAVSDSFAIAVPITNPASSSNSDSINISIERSYPNNFIVTQHKFRVAGIPYKDTVYLYIKSKDAATAGINKITVDVNYDHVPTEVTYTNNVATFNPYIAGNGINLVSPKRYDIVSHLNGDTVELVAQSMNLFNTNNQFVFEIDTSYQFNSPWKKRDSSTSIVGMIKKWPVKLLGTRDSIVYYWRAKIYTGTIQGGDFVERSFIHIFDNASGWSQSHFPQFYPSSQLTGMELDREKRQFKFTKTAERIFVNTWLDKKPNFGIKKGGHGALSLTPGTQTGIVAILFDKNSLEQFKLPGIFNPTRYFGPNYYEDAVKAYNFSLSPAWEYQFLAWIDSIPDSTYVALCNVNDFGRMNVSSNVVNAFDKLGSKLFREMKTNLTSFAMIGRKGTAPGWAVEDTGHYYDGNGGYIEIDKEMIGSRSDGTLRTELIGPTTAWDKLYFYNKPTDGKIGDNFYINIHGISNTGKDSIVYEFITENDVDLSSIDAKRFPNIYMEGFFSDVDNYTAPQLKHWRISNDAVPEGSINPSMGKIVWRDTLEQGENFNYEMGFQNISKLTFAKNLKYQTLIYNLDTKDTVLNEIKLYPDSLRPDKNFMISTLLPTKTMKGRYAYAVKVNFDENNKSLIPELSLVNNSALKYFFVDEDKINPLLDVTFDGKHINNGEIVSSNPVITISSKDENKRNWQTDSSGIQIWWKRPNSSIFERINFDTFGVKFYPATSSFNLAKAEFAPKNLPDGLYTLKVQSNDANGTKAGATEYMINFVVISKASATNFYPYPNPFTSSMRFVFTLTGTKVPDYINVKIMTIQGKVVKELNKDDLGDIHIGNNITDVVWDGTDEFGDRLANGVYLYTVTIKSDGEEIKQLENDNISNDLNADKANNDLFKHSTGKIVLLR